MATRFYLPSSGTAPVAPAYNTGWEDTSIAAALPGRIYKKSTAGSTVSFDDASAANRDILYRQYVSQPLLAQTIAIQTIKFQILASQTDAGNNLFTTLLIYVVNNAGSSVIGTVLAMTKDGTEPAASLTNRLFSATSSSLAVSESDRLVFEIGLSGDPANGKSHDGSLRIGDVSVSDLPEDDTTTADNNSWIEFATGVSMRTVDYKIVSINDIGTSTTVVFRVYRNDYATPLTRSTVFGSYTKVLSGSNTPAQCRTDLITNECFKYGTPISAQQ